MYCVLSTIVFEEINKCDLIYNTYRAVIHVRKLVKSGNSPKISVSGKAQQLGIVDITNVFFIEN